MADPVPSLSALLKEAGADSVVQDYVKARGLTALGTFALLAKDHESLRKVLIQPLMQGFKKGPTEFVLDDADKPVAEAVLLTVWDEANRIWANHMKPADTSAGKLSNAASAPSNVHGAADDKPPKQLPAGVWNSAIKRYNDVQTQGINRSFPERELAESVLARAHFEHTKTKLYTPIGLGELMQHRSFTAVGDPNPLVRSKADAKTTLTVEGDKLVQEAEKVWAPKSVLSVIDAIRSIQWAWILLDFGPELKISEFCDWLCLRLRAKPNKLEQFRIWYEQLAWQLAMQMRVGKSFVEAIEHIRADLELYHETMPRQMTWSRSIGNTFLPKALARQGGHGARQHGIGGLDIRHLGTSSGPNRGIPPQSLPRLGSGQGQKLTNRGSPSSAKGGEPMTCDAAHVIILSFFDGIGSGPFVFKELFGRPKAVFSWEIDQLCMNVSSYHVPETQHRGDLAADSPAALAAEILALDPDKTVRILILGGPPCPDFSSIKAQPAGRAGPEGMKFDQMCDFCDRLEQLLNDWPPFWFLVENVVLKAKGEIQHFSARLKCQPILADAADFGVVSRPRWARRMCTLEQPLL